MAAEVCEDGRKLIVALRAQGKSYREIEMIVHTSSRTIGRVLLEAGMAATPCRADHIIAREARAKRDAQVRDIGAMLADLLPEGGSVTAKNPAMTSEEILKAACPYARVTVWLDARDPSAFVDGATFCALYCQTGACETEPSRYREDAFRRYVAKRVREAGVIARQDVPVAAARYRMEMAGETMWAEVNTREVEGRR